MLITVNGLSVCYTDTGKHPERTVLLLHGWGVDHTVYHLIIDRLSPYCRVIAPDLPGFGGSQEPPAPWRPKDYGDFVAAFAQKLGLTEVIAIGHSNGGRVWIDLLSRDGLPFQVTKAILIDSAGLPAHHSLSYHLKVLSFKSVKAIFSLPLLRSLFPDAVEHARNRHGSSDYRHASPVLRQSMVMALNEDFTARLPKITVPTLLLWGKDDTATPLTDGQLMQARIPDAGLVVLNGGHWAFAEDFGHCGPVLDVFLKQE